MFSQKRVVDCYEYFHLNLWAQSLPRVFFGMAGGPPVCSRCGSHELAFLSEDLRRTWAAERGVQWDYKGGLGYWRLCQACHRKVRAALHTIFCATLFCSVPFCSVRFGSVLLCCAVLGCCCWRWLACVGWPRPGDGQVPGRSRRGLPGSLARGWGGGLFAGWPGCGQTTVGTATAAPCLGASCLPRDQLPRSWSMGRRCR